MVGAMDAETLTAAADAMTATLPMVAFEAEQVATQELGELAEVYSPGWVAGYEAAIETVRALGEMALQP